MVTDKILHICFWYSVNSVVEIMAVISGQRMPYSGQENLFLLQRDSTLVSEKQFRANAHGQGSTASVSYNNSNKPYCCLDILNFPDLGICIFFTLSCLYYYVSAVWHERPYIYI